MQFTAPTTLFRTVTMHCYQIISVVCGQRVAEIGNLYDHYAITKCTNIHVMQQYVYVCVLSYVGNQHGIKTRLLDRHLKNHSLIPSMGKRFIFLQTIQPSSDTHLPPWFTEVEFEWNCTSTHPCALVTCMRTTSPLPFTYVYVKTVFKQCI